METTILTHNHEPLPFGRRVAGCPRCDEHKLINYRRSQAIGRVMSYTVEFSDPHGSKSVLFTAPSGEPTSLDNEQEHHRCTTYKQAEYVLKQARAHAAIEGWQAKAIEAIRIIGGAS